MTDSGKTAERSEGGRTLRILFFSDTHLGFDDPVSPRVQRRRRGPDFMKSFLDVLSRAERTRPDLVLHGGDLFYRSRIPASLVEITFGHLIRVADQGIPILIVPGNHERGAIPRGLLAIHPRIHIFDRPRTVLIDTGGIHAAFGGFPNVRDDIRGRFPALYRETSLSTTCADFRFLCIHQTVDRAVVGPGRFRFLNRPDVIDERTIPHEVDAVLSGHIHPHQVLLPDNSRGGLRVPVIYSGSTERTSFAEENETKGFIEIESCGSGSHRDRSFHWHFQALDTRPMRTIRIDCSGRHVGADRILDIMKQCLTQLHPDTVVRICLDRIQSEALTAITAARIRSLGFDSMNITLAVHPGSCKEIA